VRFNGIGVGRVLTIGIDPTDTARVRVRIEVDEATPIRSDTVATLQSQGVTGVSFVALNSSTEDAPPLEPDPATGVPVIRSEPSVIDTLIETAPQLLREATELLRELSAIAGPENQARVAQILANVESASAGLDTALTDFSAISGSVRQGAEQISAFTGRLEAIATRAETTFAAADATLDSATRAFDAAQATLAAGTGALGAAQTAFENADRLIVQRAPTLAAEYAGLARTATGAVQDLGPQAAGLIDRLETAAGLATDRLREAEAPMAAATPALEALTGAAASVDRLVAGDGAAVAAEARTALATLNRLMETDAPLILADLRTAAATVNRVVAEVGADASAFTGRLEGVAGSAETTLADAGTTFRTATARLEELAPATAAAERALAAAQSAFASADRVMNAEVEPVVADLRAAIARLDAAVAQVADDLPAISAEVRGAAESAGRAAARVETLVDRAAPPVEAFAVTGLPQFARVATDARALVAALDQLIARIDRDPARFLLGGRAPEYRP
jgi:phospholipid/cholesterol/gamma-HCH transport system substrate-binding protein